MSERRPNPYVGPRPFDLGEKLYGRERETRELVGRLIAERIVLVHSPSGAGKTSLLQAAVIPRLKERDFNPLPILHVAREARNMMANRHTFSVLTSLEKGLADTERLDDAALASLLCAGRGPRQARAAAQVVVPHAPGNPQKARQQPDEEGRQFPIPAASGRAGE